MIAVIDYNTGNPNSVANMIKRIGYKCRITALKEDISTATALVIPGVGTFDKGMQNLLNTGLADVITQKAMVEKVPVLGICLGMQIMCNGSEEGKLNGLGWFPVPVKRFSAENNPGLKIPQIGWNQVDFNPSLKLSQGFTSTFNFYFANSYHPDCFDNDMALCHSVYGYKFVSGLIKDNLCGVQFHPEKSHSFGMRFLKQYFDHYLK